MFYNELTGNDALRARKITVAVHMKFSRYHRLSRDLALSGLVAFFPAYPAASAGAFQGQPATAATPANVAPGEEIIVQGTRERSPYRLPAQTEGFDPEGTVESVLRERRRWMEGGESGIGSCSNIGPGGMTGCDVRAIDRAYQQGRKIGIGSQRASAGLSLGKVWLGTGSKP